ncbi:hypothetical protein vBBceHLY2_00148 [Bacillus phage vB_BceH_LY2]|nr:hypothetical protein vBBceHLY2_00148 [Bacillus phage vB_BceH_LY2]
MTDFEKEIISMYEWLDRRVYIDKNGKKRIPFSQLKYFLKDFKATVEKYKDKEVK